MPPSEDRIVRAAQDRIDVLRRANDELALKAVALAKERDALRAGGRELLVGLGRDDKARKLAIERAAETFGVDLDEIWKPAPREVP